MSQSNILLTILGDGLPHSSFELLSQVYHASGPTAARLGARIYDLKKQGHKIKGWRDEQVPTKWWYQRESAPQVVHKGAAPGLSTAIFSQRYLELIEKQEAAKHGQPTLI